MRPRCPGAISDRRAGRCVDSRMHLAVAGPTARCRGDGRRDVGAGAADDAGSDVPGRDAVIPPLNWHRAGPGVSRAWAPALNPEAVMPPYYETELAGNTAHRAARNVFLVQCKTCGGDRQQICSEINLAVAKASAQADYDKRVRQQIVDKAV